MNTEQKFLMCAADYFGVHYVINPWMKGHVNQINHSVAQSQWNNLHQIMQKYAQVELLKPNPKLPDLVFTANAGFIREKKVVLGHFRPKQRRHEEPINEDWFNAHGYTIVDFPKDIYFEGEGDALSQPGMNIIWMGYGIRSDLSAAKELEKIFAVKIIALQLTNLHFYHLDTCFCPLANGYIMYYPDAFTDVALQLINETIVAEKQIIISKEDAMSFACNAVNIQNENKVIILNTVSEALQQQLNKIGYQVITTPLHEFIKAGGAAKCLALAI